jgi:hypothetical protein
VSEGDFSFIHFASKRKSAVSLMIGQLCWSLRQGCIKLADTDLKLDYSHQRVAFASLRG